ncbi:unnamed protein product, partial [Onchocerca ochengi]
MLEFQQSLHFIVDCIHCLYFEVKELVRKSNDLKFERKFQQEGAESEIKGEKEPETKMVPKPYDDLFIEPAGDYDIVYADYNAT